MAVKAEKTSNKVASKAGKLLADSTASAKVKSVAASALTQSTGGEKTSKKIASKAGKLLADSETPKKVRSVAGSVLTQKGSKKK